MPVLQKHPVNAKRRSLRRLVRQRVELVAQGRVVSSSTVVGWPSSTWGRAVHLVAQKPRLRLRLWSRRCPRSRFNLLSSGPAAPTFGTTCASVRSPHCSLPGRGGGIHRHHWQQALGDGDLLHRWIWALEDVTFPAPHCPSIASTAVQVDEAFLCS